MKRLFSIFAVAATLGLGGCSSLGGFGPKAKIRVVKSEVKKTKKIGSILIPAAMGIKSDDDVSKAALAGAIASYPPPTGIPVDAIGSTLSAIGAPDFLGEVLLASYQLNFTKTLATYNKAKKKNKKKKFPSKMALPNKKIEGVKVPKNKKQAKALMKEIKTLTSGGEAIKTALTKGNPKSLQQALSSNKRLTALINATAAWLVDSSDVTYIILSKVKGNEEKYNAKKSVYLTAGMVNVKTGKFRYFAQVNGKQGDIPLPWIGQMGAMSNSIFSKANEKAAIPES